MSESFSHHKTPLIIPKRIVIMQILHFCFENICLAKYNLGSPVLPVGDQATLFGAMFTLYRIGFCSVAKVAPAQCEQELMFCCCAEIVRKRSQCEQKPYPLCNLQRSLLI